jgi:cardiolipin synthase
LFRQQSNRLLASRTTDHPGQPMLEILLIYGALEVLIRVVTVIYVPQRRSPAAARVWLLLILLLPLPGLIAYAAFGRIALPRGRHKLFARFEQQLHQAKRQWREGSTVEAATMPGFTAVVQLALSLGDFPAQAGNGAELLPHSAEAIARLESDIEGARTHVHLLYYIFAPDQVGERIAAALVRAAARGVACRVLMDSVGSRAGLISLAPRLVAAGIEVTEMLPVGLLRRKAGRLDLRNHRKIAVIDGMTAHVGSLNLEVPISNGDLAVEDLVVRLTGPVASALQVVFMADRYVEREQSLPTADLFPPCAPAGTSIVQVLPSGPVYGQANFKLVAQQLIQTARRRVCLTTPYFVPDEAFLECLQTAVSRGVEVVLLVSHRSDHHIVSWAQQSYYEELLENGIVIHLYEPGFLHSKLMTIDDEVAVIGSANFDIRSFWLNNEINLLIYDAQVAAALHRIETTYIERSTTITAAMWSQRTALRRVIHNIARLADSLL